MIKKSQKQTWENIADEWHEFKTKPAEHVLEFLKDKKGKILDLGSGSGRHLVKVKGTLYLVDFSEKMIKLAEKRAKERKIDAEFFVVDITKKKLPIEDNFFDSAIAIAFFHCINPSNHEKAIKELFRVLKPKAEVEIAVWNKDSRRFEKSPKEIQVKWRDKGSRYYYLFDEKEIHDLFKKAGFKIKKRYEPERNIIFIAQKP
ncbi:MAG: class I SAM-dependent methyltransferase [archaeon]|nr:class I SAM-dependent methyltransferase [archaeon]